MLRPNCEVQVSETLKIQLFATSWFTMAPILHHLDPEQEFVVDVIIWAILSKRLGNHSKMYPCAFYSTEYRSRNWKTLTIKSALEE